MGEPKALLPLGGATALERAARSIMAAGIGDIVVVTGHERLLVAAEIARLGLREAHNPDYVMGMFTSIQAGVRSLPEDIGGFLILPVDCALVRSRVITALMETHQGKQEAKEADVRVDVLHPTCCGLRGHPPLVDGRLRNLLVTASPENNLGAMLDEQTANDHEVEVGDASILLDMDSPEDYRRLRKFAEAIDRQEQGGALPEPCLDEDDAAYLLYLFGVEERVVRHCQAVAAVATDLAIALNTAGLSLDAELVRLAALLHDMAKGRRRHAIEARAILTHLGFPLVGTVVGSHMALPSREVENPGLSEAQLVYLADKMVVEDSPAGLEARTEYALRTYGRDEASVANIRRRIRAARAITVKIEATLGRSLEDVICSSI